VSTAGTRVLDLLEEAPELTFRQYSIAFHLAARWCGRGPPPQPGETPLEGAMRSYEDDMLLYAHRDEAPFSTRVIATETETVTVRFPPELVFESEGRRKRVTCAGAASSGRTRDFGLAVGETVFQPSKLGILSLVLTAKDELNEYDVIKLVKLWEGGEGVGLALSAIEEGTEVWFSTTPGECATLHDLVGGMFPDWELLAYEQPASHCDKPTAARHGYRVGTLELALPAGESTTALFEDVATLKRRREAPEPDSDRWNGVVAVGGILQGLLDFREIEDYELADVFAEVDVNPDDGTMLAFHKGTLLSLAAAEEDSDEEADERESPIGIDPYLAVPNIVLLHDEQRLKSARLLERDLFEKQRLPLRDLRGRAAIDKTENGLSEMAGLLAQHLPNVFHYTSERRLQKRGRESRGLEDLEKFMRLRVDDLSNVLQSRVRARDRWTAGLGIAVGVVIAFLVQQAIEGRPLWLVVLGAVGLFGVFLRLRDRLF
jgi:hypothetical protein